MDNVVRLNPHYMMLCSDEDCDVIMFWRSRTTRTTCPTCGATGEGVKRIDTAPEGYPVVIERRVAT